MACLTAQLFDVWSSFSMNATAIPSGVLTGAETIINNGFSYDPSTQAPITSISASVDKNLGVNIQGSGFGNTFRPTIEQGGVFYTAAIPGPALNTGPGGGFTGYNTIVSPLTATDFVQYDPTNSTSGTAHPDFAGTGRPLAPSMPLSSSTRPARRRAERLVQVSAAVGNGSVP